MKNLEEKVVKNLEVISDQVDQSLEALQRLAMDPMHMDFATKYMKSVLPRQEQNMVLLFEKLRVPPVDLDQNDELLMLARSKLDKISELYLEEL